MLSLILHATAGVLVTALAFYLNAHLYRGSWSGKAPSALELAYYAIGVVSVCLGWYFNVQYTLVDYPQEASWIHFTKLLFTNSAACSGSQDYVLANAVFFPMWVLSDGPRRGLKKPFVFFLMSLFTSFGFAMGFYLAAQERAVRYQAAHRG